MRERLESAMERIKEISFKVGIGDEAFSTFDEIQDTKFLLKAFREMHEIAIGIVRPWSEREIAEEFECRMKEGS